MSAYIVLSARIRHSAQCVVNSNSAFWDFSGIFFLVFWSTIGGAHGYRGLTVIESLGCSLPVSALVRARHCLPSWCVSAGVCPGACPPLSALLVCECRCLPLCVTVTVCPGAWPPVSALVWDQESKALASFVEWICNWRVKSQNHAFCWRRRGQGNRYKLLGNVVLSDHYFSLYYVNWEVSWKPSYRVSENNGHTLFI